MKNYEAESEKFYIISELISYKELIRDYCEISLQFIKLIFISLNF